MSFTHPILKKAWKRLNIGSYLITGIRTVCFFSDHCSFGLTMVHLTPNGKLRCRFASYASNFFQAWKQGYCVIAELGG